MTKPQIITILKKYAVIPNAKGTKLFISEDSISEIAGKILELNKSSFVPPTENEMAEFAISKGYDPQCAIVAFDYYTEMEWVDANKKQIKSWKAKLISVWFKPEHKISGNKGGMVY